MKACLQRVRHAKVEVAGQVVGEIHTGLLVLLGVHADDQLADVAYLVDKIIGLRVFDDAAGKMNLSLVDVEGSLLVVSQFTLLGDCRKGRRPSFTQAAEPAKAVALYEDFLLAARARNIPVASGQFQAQMQVSLCNDGPVTLILDSRS